MDSNIKTWLYGALEHSGHSQASLARALCEKMGRRIYRTTINKVLRGERKLTALEIVAIENITKYPLLRKKTLPLLGYVGAGSEIFPYDGGCLEEVDAPPYLTCDTCVVKVRGDSMEPFIEDGALLFYSKNLPAFEVINKKAIARLHDGRCFIKIIKQGSCESLFTLESINRLYPDIKDVEILWAAPIDWIKPPSF